MEQNAPRRKPRRWLTCSYVILGIAVLCCGLPLGLAWWGLSRAFGIHNDVGWIDSERKKLPPAEPLPVPSPNALDTYEIAAGLLPGQEMPEDVWDWREAIATGDASEAARLLPTVREYIAACAPALAKVHEAAGQDYGQPPGPLSAEVFDQHKHQRELGHVGATAVRLAWVSGNEQGALSEAEDVYALGVLAPRDGGDVGLWVGAAIVAMAQRESTDLLLSDAVPAGLLRDHAARMLRIRAGVYPLSGTMHHEGALWLADLQQTPTAPSNWEWVIAESTPVALRGLRATMVARDVGKSREWLEDRRARLVEEFAKPADVSHFWELLRRTPGDAAARNDALAAVDARLLNHTADRWAQMVTHLAADETISCLEACRKEKGAYPKTLDELVPDYMPEVPLDPWTDQPLIYRVTPERYTLYAVGPNGVDEGGVTEGRGSMEPDLVIVPIPPPRQASAQPAAGPGP